MGMKESGMTERVKRERATAFEMVDMGPISFYLGLKVERDRLTETANLSRPSFVHQLLAKFHLDKEKSSSTPMKKAPLLPSNEKEATHSERERYQQMIGSLMFFMV